MGCLEDHVKYRTAQRLVGRKKDRAVELLRNHLGMSEAGACAVVYQFVNSEGVVTGGPGDLFRAIEKEEMVYDK